MAQTDLYKVLGVEKRRPPTRLSRLTENLRKISSRYVHHRKRRRKEKAEEKFKEINHAYEVLSDAEKRKVYDTYGSEDPQSAFTGGTGGFWGGSGMDGMDIDLGDIFSSFFGGGGSPFGSSRGKNRREPCRAKISA